MKKPFKMRSLLLVTLLMLAFTACTNTGNATTDATTETAAEAATDEVKEEQTEKKDLTKVVVSEFRGLNWSSAYIADALGYFTDEGLEVEFMIYKDGPVAFQGMHAGDSDFCLLSTEPVLKAQDEGFESVLVLTNTDMRGYAFATQTDIKTMEDLKGKTVFAGMPGSAPYSFVLSLMANAGLGENDVTFINLEYGALINAFATQQIDGTFFDIYQLDELEAAVPEMNILVNATDPKTHEELYGSRFSQTTIVTTTKKFADENPETVQKFVNASVKGLDWINKHSSAEVAEVLHPYFEGLELDRLTKMIESVKTTFSPTGIINEEGYGTVETFAVEQKLIKTPLGYGVMVRPDFAENAAKTLGLTP